MTSNRNNNFFVSAARAAATSLVMIIALLLLALSQAGAAVAWRAVPASDLRSTFVDHELADGVHYAYQFRRDGTFTGYEMAREVRGTWRVSDGELCWTWIKPRGTEECFVIERRGVDIRLIRDGSEFLSGTLSAIKPEPHRKGAP